MIIAITATGARPEAFALCQKYMARQTVGPDVWIIVDDTESAVRLPHTCAETYELYGLMGIILLRPEPFWPHSGEPNTQHRNILAALDYIETHYGSTEDALILFEDDDAYAPDYIEKQVARLKDYPLVGESPTRYYHLRHRAFREFEPNPWASLAQTAMRAEMIPALRDACECRSMIDMHLWRLHGSKGKLYEDYSVLGIKGMPGRVGVTAVHTNPIDGRWQTDDPGLSRLHQWIGHDAYAYIPFIYPPEPAVEISDDFRAQNEQYGFQTFTSFFQVRYRCPDCSYDHFSPNEVADHFIQAHKDGQEAPMPTLFDSGGKQITRKIVVPR